MSEQLYRIPALKWGQEVTGYRERWVAKAIIGTLTVSGVSGDLFWHLEGFGFYACKSIEHGKQIAEAYYRERLAEALEPADTYTTITGRIVDSITRPVYPITEESE